MSQFQNSLLHVLRDISDKLDEQNDLLQNVNKNLQRVNKVVGDVEECIDKGIPTIQCPRIRVNTGIK